MLIVCEDGVWCRELQLPRQAGRLKAQPELGAHRVACRRRWGRTGVACHSRCAPHTKHATADLLQTPNPHFPTSRTQGAVEAVLARVRRGEAPDMLAATWQAQRGVLCRGVDWERYELEQLQVGIWLDIWL